MPESEARPKRKKLEAGDIVYSPYKPPKKTPEGFRWAVEERHVDKGYPFRWRLIKLQEGPAIPPETEDSGPKPLTPAERGNYSADLVGEAIDRRDEEKETRMRQARGLPPKD
jgi:hypothetical protein